MVCRFYNFDQNHSMESPGHLSFNNTELAFKHQSDRELKRSYWLYQLINSNTLVKLGTPITNFVLKIGLPVKGLIRQTIFRQFCGGESIEQCEATINQLAANGVGTILDYSVEGEEIEAVFDQTAEEILKTIARARLSPAKVPFTVFKISGVARFALLEKVNAGVALNELESYELHKVRIRVERICRSAYEAGVPIMIDAEESWIQDAIDHLALEMMLKFNKEKAIVLNTYQIYRHDKLASLQADIILARSNNIFLGVKLVRGAYMEKERRRAAEMGYPSPIQLNKEATDRDYNLALAQCADHCDVVVLVAGTHNESSCLYLTQLLAEKGMQMDDKRFFYSQLLGMSDNLSFNLSAAGYNVAKYVPYGPLKSVMPYLFRRAQENTSIAGQSSRELSLYKKEMRRRGV